MASYYSNPYGYQTPIGQGMENIAQAMYKTAVLRKQQELDQQKLDYERQKFNELEMPLKQAQAMKSHAEMLKAQAEAEASGADVARLNAMPDTVAQMFAGVTKPQLGQIRGFQNSGTWGAAPTVEGLDQIGGGGDWMPRFATPEVMQNVRVADMATALPGKKPDDYSKAMQDLNRLMFAQGAQSGTVPVPDIQRRGMAEAAAGGKSLFGNPNGEGLVGDLFTGTVLNQSNPLANAQVSADRALAGERGATAGLRREQVNTEKAQQGKYNAEAESERANPGGKKQDGKGSLASIQEHNDKIVSARSILAGMADKEQFSAKGNADFVKLAQQRMQDGDPRYANGDPRQQDWIGYLVGRGFESGEGYTPAGKQNAKQPAASGGGASIPPPEKRVKGKTYNTPKGPMVWTGTGWVPGT